jgi:TorA maturation chaperone TorD
MSEGGAQHYRSTAAKHGAGPLTPLNNQRPNAYPSANSGLEDVDIARSEEYTLLATLLLNAPDATLVGRVSKIEGDALPLGLLHAALAEAARDTDIELIEQDYFRLFVGVGRSEVLPYASYYLTGFLNERPLARVRADLRLLGIAASGGSVQPEDHAGMLCEVMAGLAIGHFGQDPSVEAKFFGTHVAPWMGRFFADVERLAETEFYRTMGKIGRLFIEIETEAFTLPA